MGAGASARDFRNADALHLLGSATALTGDFDFAVKCIRQAIQISGKIPEYYHHLGTVLCEMGDFSAAIASYREGLCSCPDNAEMQRLLGDALVQWGDMPGAEASYRQAVQLDPSDMLANRELGSLLALRSRREDAVPYYRAALKLVPDDARTHFNLAAVLTEMGRAGEADAEYAQAARLDRASAAYSMGTMHSRQTLCAWEGLEDRWSSVHAAVLHNAGDQVNPFFFLCAPSSGPEQLICARAWSTGHYAVQAAEGAAQRSRFVPVRRDRLHVGYISSDFRNHATAYLIADMLERHNREEFAVSAYSIGPDDRSASEPGLPRRSTTSSIWHRWAAERRRAHPRRRSRHPSGPEWLRPVTFVRRSWRYRPLPCR